jgi:L-alanine-DL-glutamate epimerase-like enolase superfamily enzyme
VTLIEQPLPAGHDEALKAIKRPVAICADESAHDSSSLAALADRYDAVNVKLDKTGGLTGAITALHEAERAGLAVMIGCMVCTSLAIAPALLLAGCAQVVDLDGPLLLARDRPHGLRYDGSVIHPATAQLWG